MNRRRTGVAVSLVVMLTLAGAACHKTATAPVPGQLNTFDAVTYRALSDAQAAINSFKADIASGKLTETPAIKTALNQLITDYNAANTLYQAYHASGGTNPSQSVVQASVTKVQGDVSAVGGAQ